MVGMGGTVVIKNQYLNIVPCQKAIFALKIFLMEYNINAK